MQAGTSERAERASRSRAILMALGAVVIVVSALLQASDASRHAQDSAWIVLVAVWLAMLATGGGFGLTRQMRALMNDELSLANRGRALGTGFFAAMLASLGVLVVNLGTPVATPDAIRIVTAAGLAAALLRYAMLEWR